MRLRSRLKVYRIGLNVHWQEMEALARLIGRGRGVHFVGRCLLAARKKACENGAMLSLRERSFAAL